MDAERRAAIRARRDNATPDSLDLVAIWRTVPALLDALAEAGASASDVVHAGCYLTAIDLGTFPAAKVWYRTLLNLWPNAKFEQTIAINKIRYLISSPRFDKWVSRGSPRCTQARGIAY